MQPCARYHRPRRSYAPAPRAVKDNGRVAAGSPQALTRIISYDDMALATCPLPSPLDGSTLRPRRITLRRKEAAVSEPPPPPPRLLDQVRAAARRFGLPTPQAERCAGWAKQLIVFHGKRHPRERRAAEALRCREPVAAADPAPVASLGPASAHAGAARFTAPRAGRGA